MGGPNAIPQHSRSCRCSCFCSSLAVLLVVLLPFSLLRCSAGLRPRNRPDLTTGTRLTQLSLAAAMLDCAALGEVDGVFGDVGGQVGDAFEVAGDEEKLKRGRDR